MTSPLLEVESLSVRVPGPPELELVSDVSFSVEAGKTVGLVGESGCGKSVSALSILGLMEGARCTGTARFEGRDLVTMPEPELRSLRGRRVSMIFQDPATSLDPSMRVGDQIGEPLRVHEKLGRAARRQRAVELLRAVGVPAPEIRVDAHPHQLSGGLKQRVMIAMAVACRPALLIADEPTTALDVTVQAQVIDLLGELRRAHGMGLLLISHDLGLVAETADEVCVMYAGQIVERGPTAQVLSAPRHPYTAGLLASTPTLTGGEERLHPIEGAVPDVSHRPRGCRFRERCPSARAECASAPPAWVSDDEKERGGHRCLFPISEARS